MILEKLKGSYGNLFEQSLIKEIVKEGIYKEIPAETSILKINEYVSSIPLVLSGAIKVFREDSDSGELLLYYLEKGTTCSMTMTCCTVDKRSKVKLITELDSEIIFIPISKMDEWAGKYKTWRNFVLSSYNKRIDELFEIIDNIAFKKMDERLYDYLLEKKNITDNNIIYTTHQNIALEINTSRVVISRLLKSLEQIGKVKLNRNFIEIL